MIIQCDFDGTITSNNLSVLLREHFARGNWRKIDDDYLHGKLTVEQSNKMQFALIKEPREKLQEFARKHIDVKPGFVELIRYCQESSTSFVIVSSGLDFYIEMVLKEIGLSDLEVHCGQTSFGKDGITVTYTDPEGNIINSGFKRKYLTYLRKQGRSVIYIGDGLSDLEAASLADYIFATEHLVKLLGHRAIPYIRFSDFHDLLHQLCLLF